MALSYLIGRRNHQNTPWNDERDALLIRLWAEGYSASQIADQIMDVEVSRCAVIGRAHRLKLPAHQARAPAKRKPYKGRKPKLAVRDKTAKIDIKAPPPPLGEPKMRRLTLMKLKPTSCRWPIDYRGGFLFCGVNAVEGGVYCPFHQRMARVRKRDE